MLCAHSRLCAHPSRRRWGARTLAAILLACAPALAPAQPAPARVLSEAPARAELPAYEAVAARTLVRDDAGEPWAWIHSYAYLAPDAAADRPVTFFFNGGPGASTALLHLSVGGPVRADLGADGSLEPNPFTLLDRTDLVYVDPVGTGFSHAAGAYKDADLWGATPDARASAAFVREYLEHLGRPDAPVFLCGESYGAMRAAFMLEPLQTEQPRVDVRGLVFISPALTTESFVPMQSGVNTLADRLPTYAAIAYDAGLIEPRGRTLQEVCDEAYEFAQGDYRRAISDIKSVEPERMDRIADYLHALTGIGTEPLKLSRFSILPMHMSVARQDPMGRRLDPHDGRRSIPMTQLMGGVELEVVLEALGDQLRRTWRVDASEYTLFNPRANQAWKRSDGTSHIFTESIELAPIINAARERNPELRLFIATGFFDVVTPFGVPRRLLEQGQLDPASTTLREYVGGHMVYVDRPEFERLHADLHAFYESLVPVPARTGP
ncbi:MAG: hypothetical protein ACF8SC_13395 [Phycisphaerales bacterium JB037]